MKRKVYQHDSLIASYLIEKDPNLKKLFEKKKEIIVQIDDDYFVSLLNTIIAQQLSSKVASVISQRVYHYFHGELTPENILKTEDEALRSLGLSYQKIKYIKSLSEAVQSNVVQFDQMN